MATLDTASIRSGNEHEVARYLRNLSREGDVENATQQLIDAVESGSIAPSTLKIWLSISHEPAVLKKAFEQNTSVRIRKIAIDQLEKLLKSRKWKETWDGLGAVEGFVNLFRSLSTSDVQDICRGIGSSTKGEDSEKREVITDLFEALQSQKLDTRPLAEYYRYLLPGCTKSHAAKAVDTQMEGSNHRQQDLLLRNHSDVLHDNFLKMVLDYDGPDRPWLFGLMQNYPATPAATRPHLSSSMEFSLEVLRSLVQDGNVPQISDEAFMFEIAQPLLLRCLKRGVATETVKEVADLICKYINRRPSAGRVLQVTRDYYWDGSKNKAKLVEKVAKSWLRTPEILGDLFRLLLGKLQLHQPTRDVPINAFDSLLKKFDLKVRYKLLKFCIRFSTIKNDEKDITFDGALARTTGELRSDILGYFKPEDALDLIHRARKAKGDKLFGTVYIGNTNGLFSTAKEEPSEKPTKRNSHPPVDSDLWQVYFLQRASRQEEAENLAKLRIAERKKAQSTPDEQYRLLHARAVVFYAIASGSLSILGEAINWTKRLTRDPKITIFKDTPSEIHKVLSGLPSTIGNDASALRDQVKEANRIMRNLCDIVFSGSKDPAFEISNWKDIFDFPHRAIYERAVRSAELKEYFSDEEIYSILWEDTLKLLIDVEQKVVDNSQLQNADENYYKTGIRDFKCESGRSSMHIESTEVHTSVYRFFDRLAEARNELWKKHRISKCPDVADLTEPFPQGLPVQYLLPFSLTPTPPPDDLTPYIALRTKSAVFPPVEISKILIPTKKNPPIANGDPLQNFIDDYQYALNLYISVGVPEQERRTRFDSAWDYAIGPLSEGRMTTEQAIRYWRNIFTNTIVNPDQSRSPYGRTISEYLNHKRIPEHEKRIFREDLTRVRGSSVKTKPEALRIPAINNADSILDWDAIPELKENIAPQRLSELTYIDITTNNQNRIHLEHYTESRDKDYLGYLSNTKIPGQTYWRNAIWTRQGNQKAKALFQSQEAQIMSALLYLQTKTQLPEKLLASPFPSADDMRYPASRLSAECLSKLTAVEEKTASPRRRRGRGEGPRTTKGLKANTKAALKALEAQISSVPPTLMLKLVESALSSLDAADREDRNTDFTALEALTYNLLRLLARSDRPKLALEPANRIILKHPAACFWFKTIFTQGFFRDLTPQDAGEGMAKFSETVSSLLDQMEKAKESKKTKPTDEKTSGEEKDTGAKEQGSGVENPESSVEEPQSEAPKEESGFVKVSTIKLLVELFEDADFLPKESSLSNIHTLSKTTSNADIHRTVIYYLTRVLKSPQPLELEFFSILSTLIDKTSETDIHRLILQLVIFGLKTSKYDNKHQSLAVSVISSVYKKSSGVEITKQVLEYLTLALDTPLSSDTTVQALFLSMVLEMSKGDLDSKLRDNLVVYLLRLLEMSTSEGYNQILDVLQGLVSNCGNINEIEPVTEDQWKTLEETLVLPKCDIWGHFESSRNPVFMKLIEFHKKVRQSASLNATFTDKVMIPIINELNSQYSRYFSIFFEQKGISRAEQQAFKLPPSRRITKLINTVIQNGLGEGIIPLIRQCASHAIFCIDPPEILNDLNKRLDEEDDNNPDFKNTEESRNWRKSYYFGPAALDELDLIQVIRERTDLPDEEKLGTVVREEYLKLYRVTFWKEAKELDFDTSDSLLKNLEPKILDKVWLKYFQPILQDTLSFVNSLRTAEWEQNSDRNPQILPDIFRAQLWLLNIPSVHRNDQDQETRCRIFTEEVLKVLDDIRTSHDFVSKVSDLEGILYLVKNDAEDNLIVATNLGDLANVEASPLTIQGYTRIELASKMLNSLRHVKSENLKKNIDKMFKSWKSSQVEAVRRLGYSASSPELEEEKPPSVVEKKREPRSVQKRSGRTKKRQRGRKSRWGPPDFNLDKPTNPMSESDNDDDW
ncbi:hypothetical protein TWF225_003168 [Orbilia oligospora]|uniref:Uncharacterized protein n=1 Tax=Orbilia oligospora TaxID=2813651 RepID=A0A7C8PXS6_ORBOL|nr:hypothetical protein TWF751_006037 [Orbilia oligospora]KAF3188781.1 hypothetical protein TWF225_003168 [Orbilia oligospora]KAF3263079.1 hypothetical protein TWF128_002042 [Orbilia oligospora]KAF3267449.1 hypothetical protein TWF217_000504 [Orbilia oligospora]KAF3294468.1 hypothetical protein TWF132_003444 [Orbilia oligospora]